MANKKKKKRITDTERLIMLLEQCVCYVYVGEDEQATDISSRKDIDKVIKRYNNGEELH